MRLTDFRVLSFDCYGTLIDWETGIAAALRPLSERRGADRRQDEILESFARHETAQEAETPGMIYSELLARVHRRLAAEWGAPVGDDAHRAFGRSVGDWPAFADSPASLRYLKQFYKLVILSNVDRRSFARSSKRLGVEFDAVYTAEDVGCYKPDLRGFRHMIAALEDRGSPARRDPACRAEPVPRPRPGQCARPALGLDRPPQRRDGRRGDPAAAGGRALRFPFWRHGRIGRGPPRRIARLKRGRRSLPEARSAARWAAPLTQLRVSLGFASPTLLNPLRPIGGRGKGEGGRSGRCLGFIQGGSAAGR